MSSRSNGVTNASSSRCVDLAVDLVAALLERLDLRDPLVEPVVVLDHLAQRRRGRLEVLAVGDEEVEELDVLRQQAEGHRVPPVVLSRSRWSCEPMTFRTTHDAATMPAAGMVMIQANRMRRATPQRTPAAPRAEPTPMIALEMTCVVDTGMPEMGGAEQDGGGRRLGREAVDRLELGDPVAHRLHDPPAADGRPQRERRGGHDDDPDGTSIVGMTPPRTGPA